MRATSAEGSSLPTVLRNSVAIQSFGLSNWQTCAIDIALALWCWGYNANGQIGDGTATNRSTPSQVGSAKWTHIAGDNSFNCGIQLNQSLWCWGYNQFGQLGDGTTTQRTSPASISPGSKWTSVSVGDEHACGIQEDMSLWCWGRDSTGQLGDGGSNTNKLSPVRVGSDLDWIEISAGGGFTCGIRSTGVLLCWGRGDLGQLG